MCISIVDQVPNSPAKTFEMRINGTKVASSAMIGNSGSDWRQSTLLYTGELSTGDTVECYYNNSLAGAASATRGQFAVIPIISHTT